MYGYLVLDESARGRRSVLTGERVCGMPLLQISVPAPAALREKALHRRLRRAGERLWEQGVNRVLVGESFPPGLWEALRQAGLAPVEVEELCREAAEPLALALLARRGLRPEKATVCLSGAYALGAVQNAAAALAPKVGRLVIDCPGQGGELARWLWREYGLPLIEAGSVKADLTVAFTRERGGEADLKLYGACPDLGGLRLLPAERELPPGFAELPLLAALRECGCLRREELRVACARTRDEPAPA